MSALRMTWAMCLAVWSCVAWADCPFGPEQCKPGFVWRDAFAGDKVCVTGEVKAQAADDNSKAASRRTAGSDACVFGFVWREASPSDHVCVTGDVRSKTWADNADAANRRDPACAGPLTIKGNLQYSESEDTLAPRPIAGAEIELWFCGNWFGPSCSWNRLEGGKTDDAGNYSWTIPGGRDPRDWYQVRVYARNNAVIVYQQDTASNFWHDVLPQAVQATPGNNVVQLSKLFGNTGDDLFASRHFNVATKLLPAREFVLRFRDGTETDTIGRVLDAPALINQPMDIAFTNAGITHMPPTDMFDEGRVIVHEYGHYFQEQIGTYHAWPARHDGCTAFVLDANALINSAEYAWFEGFADFFSDAVRLYFAGRYAMPQGPKTPSTYSLKTCSALGKTGPAGIIGSDAIEQRVEDFLFLMMNDDGSVCGPPSDSADYRACATPIWDQNAKLIMSIADKELDADQPGPVDVNKFAAAWLARGGSRPKLNAAMIAVGMTPPAVPPTTSPHDACLNKCAQAKKVCDAEPNPNHAQCRAEWRTCARACPA